MAKILERYNTPTPTYQNIDPKLIEELVLKVVTPFLEELSIELDGKLDDIRKDLCNQICNQLTEPLETEVGLRPTKRIVVLGLWNGAVSNLKEDEALPFLDIRYEKENTAIEKHIYGETTLIQMVKASAHLPKGVSAKFNELIHCNGGYSSLRELFTKLNTRERMYYEDSLPIVRRTRSISAPTLVMSWVGDGYLSDSGWTLTQETTKEQNQRLNGRWVLRNEQNAFMDCSYNLDLLAEVNNLHLNLKEIP